MKNNMIKIVGIALLVGAALGGAASWYLFPKIETKTVTETKEVIRNNIRTVTLTTERPDGTKETRTETVDNSIKKETSLHEKVEYKKSKWIVSAGAATELKNLAPIYTLHVQKRIAGPVFVGIQGATDHLVGLTVGLEF